MSENLIKAIISKIKKNTKNQIFADKIQNLVDANERIFEAKQPNFFQRNQNFRNQGGNQGQGGFQNRNQQNWNNNKRQGQRPRKNVSFQHNNQHNNQQNHHHNKNYHHNKEEQHE